MKTKLIFTQILFFLLSGLAWSAEKAPAITTKEIEYKANGVELKGFLAMPANVSGKVPGVLVVHEWWGHNAYARKRAKMLAKLGYAAFALDMYGDGKHTEHPQDAKQFMDEALKSGQIKPRFEAALDVLKNNEHVDASKLAAIGYCFGGNVVLTMATEGLPLKAVVSFHGALPSFAVPPVKEKVQAKILVLHGGDDQFTTPDQVAAFKKALDTAGIEYQFITYPGAKHGFTDPENTMRGKKNKLPIGYNADADKKSWSEMQSLFKSVF